VTHIISTLFPVFAVIALGYVLARADFLSKAFLNELNRFVYWVCLPALILHSLSNATEIPAGTLSAFVIFAAATLAVTALAFLNARWRGLARWQYGTFVQATLRGNLVFIGIPIIIYATRDRDPTAVTALVAQAVFIFAPVMILYNVLSVTVLVGSRADRIGGNLPQVLRNIARNPLILSALAGVLISLLPFDLPGPLNNTLDYIGRMAGPAALICAGGGMAFVSMQGRYKSALNAAILKTAAVPAFAYLFSIPFALPRDTLLVLMIFSATPTAVVSYVMAKEMGGDEAMASGAIVLSTLLSLLSLGVVVGVF